MPESDYAAYGPSPVALDVLDALREEYHALGLMSYTGDGNGGWIPDLRKPDIEKIRRLLAQAAATIEAYS